MATSEPELPELRGDGREVIDAALHLIDEELTVAERLERKAREQWQLVSFVAPIAIGAALTAVGASDAGVGWAIAIGAVAFVTGVFLIEAMHYASAMSTARSEDGLNPDRLAAYMTDLHDRQDSPAAFNQVRADLARSLVEVAKSRAQSNDQRRILLQKATTAARWAFYGAMAILVLAVAAVTVNA